MQPHEVSTTYRVLNRIINHSLGLGHETMVCAVSQCSYRIFEFTNDGIVPYALALVGLSVIPLEYMCNR